MHSWAEAFWILMLADR